MLCGGNRWQEAVCILQKWLCSLFGAWAAWHTASHGGRCGGGVRGAGCGRWGGGVV